MASRNTCIDPHTLIAKLRAEVEAMGAGTTIVVQEEGMSLGSFHTLNIVSSIATVSDAGSGVAQLDISGGAGSQNLFETFALTQSGGGTAAGDASIVADTTTDTAAFDAGANITLTGFAATDTIRIAVSGINVFSTIAVAGQTDVVADQVDDTVTYAAGSGITITTTPGTDTVTWSADGEEIILLFTEGDGIDLDGTTISVDLAASSPALEFDSGGLRVKVKEDGGLDRTVDGLQDKWRYHRIRGLAKGALYKPSSSVVTIDEVESFNGEEPVSDPSDEIETHGLPLWVDDNVELHAEFCNDGAVGITESWTTDTVENLPHILGGFDDYDSTKDMVFCHDANSKVNFREQHCWKERTVKTIYGLDPNGGHTITTSGTTLTLSLKVTKYTFDLVDLTAEDDETITINYTGTAC